MRQTTDLVKALQLRPAEQKVLVGLYDGLTHAQMAKRDNITRDGSKKRRYRAGLRAKAAGVNIPSMQKKVRRAPVVQLSAFGARGDDEN